MQFSSSWSCSTSYRTHTCTPQLFKEIKQTATTENKLLLLFPQTIQFKSVGCGLIHIPATQTFGRVSVVAKWDVSWCSHSVQCVYFHRKATTLNLASETAGSPERSWSTGEARRKTRTPETPWDAAGLWAVRPLKPSEPETDSKKRESLSALPDRFDLSSLCESEAGVGFKPGSSSCCTSDIA